MRALVIAGMARSGTTMLQQLCNAHPQMRVTNEFGNYAWIGDPYPKYAARAAARIHRIRGKWRILGRPGFVPPRFSDEIRIRSGNHAANIRDGAVHLLRLGRHSVGRVTLDALVEEASDGDPRILVVGDKLPRYAYMLNEFVQHPRLQRLVIYRDCRDVTSSFLRKLRTDWKRQRWTRHFNGADRIARRWVRAIEEMEHYRDHLHVVRYEELVADPRPGLDRIADWLGVDPSGLDAGRVSDSSIGKHRQGLTPQELDDVLRIAGSTLRRLGYALD